MSQLDPTGAESVTDERQPDNGSGPLSHDEVPGFGNGEPGIDEPATLPGLVQAGTVALEIPVPPAAAPAPQAAAVARKAVSGCYAGTLGAFQVDLRVDIDRARPMRRVSGDFYQTTGRTVAYCGSFVVDAPVITAAGAQYVVKGKGRFSFAAGAPLVVVTIPRVQPYQPQGAATLQFLTEAGAVSAVYHCAYESVYFRTVRIETDSVSDVAPPLFGSYNTGSLPSGGAGRPLSVVGAFAEAGIALSPTAGGNVIDMESAGLDATWSDAELHASMEQHFSLWADLPQWCVWQLVAQRHDEGPGLYGIMFDVAGKERQGCAVFHAGIGGGTPEKQRDQLYTYVHELGHCFNLLHSWQKHLASPPQASRPDSLSWMNYPWKYPKGSAAGYWRNFDFRFDDEELIHLRHGFRNDVIMGGSGFGTGAALGRDVLADPIQDESGLVLEISTHQRSFALGEPLLLQLTLRTTDTRGRRAHTWLHPDCGLVHVVIAKPSGEVRAYEPMIDHLVGERETVLGAGDKVEEAAYIGYGKDGLYFDQPGQYRLRAAYSALDGSQVLSNMLTVRVRYPVSETDDKLAELFMGDEQGALMYLLGSDSASLRAGNDAFDEVLDRFGEHPMATYAKLVKGVNAGRIFKTIDPSGPERIAVRGARAQESAVLLEDATRTQVLAPLCKDKAKVSLAAVQAEAQVGKAPGGRMTWRKYSAMAAGKRGQS